MSDKKGTGTASSSTGAEGTSTKNTETDKDSDGNRLPNLYDRFVSSFDSALASISKGFYCSFFYYSVIFI
ncbi:unnamed protein product [Anisakis simplex]|uniref:Uncharacterized protein n=1 Tax=Anisakis simplex TaxID=6269 RepID=A0A0M3JKD4_ANISI|nr:unnamed protein product [Anisakis simplex]VDK60991.1 unnamed protein product [Anisakis simplex]